MTREEAIEQLQDAKDGYKEYLSDDAINMAIKALEQEPAPKNDLGVKVISKSDVDRIINCPYFRQADKLIQIMNLPSVTLVTSQEPILDKIKENIQFIKDKCLPNNIAEEYEQKGLQEALDIIDKYKAESKPPESEDKE